MMQPDSLAQPLLKRVAFFLLMPAVGLLSGFIAAGCTESPSPEKLISEARTSLKRARYDQARSLADRIPQESPLWQDAMLVAGEAATKQGDLTEAIRCYSLAAEKDARSEAGLLALFSAGEVCLESGRLTKAEQFYRSVLSIQPGNGITNERMAFLTSLTGRRWESLAYYSVLIRGGESDYRELALAADVGRGLEQPEFLQKCVRQAPDDELVQMALAVQAFNEGSPDALGLLQEVVRRNPQQSSAQAFIGELLQEESQESEFLAWYEKLPDESRALPDVWFAGGLWARRHGDLETAAECFWRTVVALPHHRRAVYMLGQTLTALGDSQAGEVTANSILLVELSQTIDQVLVSEGKNEKAIQRATEILIQLGRIWEACAWAQYAVSSFPTANWAQDTLSKHGASLRKDLPMNTTALRPSGAWDTGEKSRLTGLVARRRMVLESATQKIRPEQVASAGIHFREEPAIPFTYFNADDPLTKGVRSFEQTGGGVAILDFDLDAAPDVFLPQGLEWRTGEDRPRDDSALRDVLYRNRSGRRFEHAVSGLPSRDGGFGQGCSAGDTNNDGFPDIYVGNVGRNRLLHNMGDGTFLDVTDEAELSDEVWTTSVMICDLNGDGLPDLFDVNYLKGTNVYQMICMGRACSPSVFPGERDLVLVNQGDGKFQAARELTPEENTKGLGVVAFYESPGMSPDLFIANDQVGNHFLRNQQSENPHRLDFQEESLITGLAYNEYGLPMACMGVAADDWDRNNLLDLFVTNFHNESNTMYLQDTRGLFIDATNALGLKAASVPFTGWGTQSLDADLDGYPDLVVTNGHVDDYRDVGGEYHMRPQFFVNRGGRFDELLNDDAGAWFTQKFLGRGLARVDWTLDGLPEFIVSNMNSRLSVLVNETSPHGHFLNLRLVAASGSRDAVGTFVTLETDGNSIVKQLVAGDGYMACNERVLQFGLGNQTTISRLTIHWPSGEVSVFENPATDATWIAVEGRNGLYRLPSP